MLAIADDVPEEFEVVPVYIRASQESREMVYRIAECKIPNPQEETVAVDEIWLQQGRVLRLGFGADR